MHHLPRAMIETREQELTAWPLEWNAEFKLLAPYNTTVEGRVEKGRIVRLLVTPQSRRNDVEVISGGKN